MGDAGEPVVEQPKVEQVQEEEEREEVVDEGRGEVASSWGSWGVSLLTQPHLLEASLGSLGSQVAQVMIRISWLKRKYFFNFVGFYKLPISRGLRK